MKGKLSRSSALGLLTAAAFAVPPRSLAQTKPLIRVGVESQGETFASVYYGAKAGIFSKADLDVETC